MGDIFKNGDQVELNSGGPLMTVDNDRTDGYIDCYWFDAGKLENHTFHHLAIHRIPLVPQAKGGAGCPQGLEGAP